MLLPTFRRGEENSDHENPVKEARPLRAGTTRFGMFLTRIVPRRLGPPLALWCGRMFARMRPGVRAIVESNISPVLGTGDPRRVRKIAAQAFGHAALAYYELFNLPALSQDEIAGMVEIEEPGLSQFQEAFRRGKGIVLVSPHLSSFELAAQSLIARDFPFCFLTLPDQVEGIAFANRKRSHGGPRVLSTGARDIREAIRFLMSGGILVTGGDRPVKGHGVEVEFLGRPTILPDGSARLAVRTGAALIVGAVRRENKRYKGRMERIEWTRRGDDDADVRELTQLMARIMESTIRLHPEQWHLFRRLWDA
jgi:phosphatidylinositol dimannoside acyltransferase